jgi:uncharacterized protein YodC (DUF2158 family)
VRNAACSCPTIDNSTADSALVYIPYAACASVLTVSVGAAGPTTICSGGSVVLNSTVSTSGSYQYQWYDNNGAISGATSASYTASSAGTYYLVVTSQGSILQAILSL